MRIGTMCCPCCGAREDKTQLVLAYQCKCRWQDCQHCHKCLTHCGCPVPLRPAWASSTQMATGGKQKQAPPPKAAKSRPSRRAVAQALDIYCGDPDEAA